MDTFTKKTIVFNYIVDKLFETNGFECRKLHYGKDIFYCAKDILSCLDYSDEESVTKKNLNKINKKNKFTFKELEKIYNVSELSDTKAESLFDINKETISSFTQYEKDYIFLNKEGLYKLINSSNKKRGEEFKYFVYDVLLPMLDSLSEECDKQKYIIDFFN